MTSLEKLQNGSDIRGIAIATEEYPANLTPAAMEKIASGLIHWLRTKTDETPLVVGVGQDSRLSGTSLKTALIDALIRQGVDVIDFHLATTPAMFMSTQFPEFACHAGVMLTASHLPYYFHVSSTC